MAFYGVGDNLLSTGGEPERLSGVPVSDNFFQLLGVKPLIGRLFTAEECKWHGPKAVLLSYGLWTRRFAANPAIAGTTLRINDEPGHRRRRPASIFRHGLRLRPRQPLRSLLSVSAQP